MRFRGCLHHFPLPYFIIIIIQTGVLTTSCSMGLSSFHYLFDSGGKSFTFILFIFMFHLFCSFYDNFFILGL